MTSTMLFTMRSRCAVTLAVAASALTGLTVTGSAALGSPASAAPGSRPVHDLDGDRSDDVVVGAMGRLGLRLSTAGLVRLEATASSFSAESMAIGDFDGDGDDDLAGGDPWATVGGVSGAGEVWVLPGATGGPNTGAVTRIHQDVAGVPDDAERGDHFGAALAAADFDGDGFDDLAIGTPDEGIESRGVRAAGSVTVIPGSASGLVLDDGRLVVQVVTAAPELPEPEDRLGTALAAGDVTGDGVADLAVTAPGDRAEGARESRRGAVVLMPGATARGVTGTTASVVRADDLTRLLAAAGFDGGLAVADVTGDGHAEVVTGTWGRGCGGVFVLRGGGGGIRAASAQYLDQESPGVPGACEIGEFWGAVVAAGDLTGDGHAEVVVGNPSESVGDREAAGAYLVLRGSAAGVSTAGSVMVTQDSTHVSDRVESGDHFAAAVALHDLDGDRRADVVVGAPAERVDGELTGWVAGLLSGPDGRVSATAFTFTGRDLGTSGVPVWGVGKPIG